jgi:hypothetical protein
MADASVIAPQSLFSLSQRGPRTCARTTTGGQGGSDMMDATAHWS